MVRRVSLLDTMLEKRMLVIYSICGGEVFNASERPVLYFRYSFPNVFTCDEKTS